MKELQECGEWFAGPSWLGENISRENEFSDVIIMPSECLKELRVKDREVVTLRVVESTRVSIGSIMDFRRAEVLWLRDAQNNRIRRSGLYCTWTRTRFGDAEGDCAIRICHMTLNTQSFYRRIIL